MDESSLRYRSLRPEEVPLAADVFLVSVAELARAHGLSAPSYTRASIVPLYEHLLATGIFEVAELDGKLVGIAAASVRGSVWFLAMFWVLPAYKLRGIGKPLLERVRRLGEAQGASAYFTWSSIDFTAVASYLKLGLLPGGPIFTFAGKPSALPELPAGARLTALEPKQASDIDCSVRGAPRALDHAFWSAGGVPGFQLELDGRVAGYCYVKDGFVGPAAWVQAEDGPALLACALREAASQAAEVKLIALGCNQTALGAATRAGLRLVSGSHLLLSAPFGRLKQYLPSGPGLF